MSITEWGVKMSEINNQLEKAFQEIMEVLNRAVRSERAKLERMIDNDDDELYEKASRQYRLHRKEIRQWQIQLEDMKQDMTDSELFPEETAPEIPAVVHEEVPELQESSVSSLPDLPLAPIPSDEPGQLPLWEELPPSEDTAETVAELPKQTSDSLDDEYVKSCMTQLDNSNFILPGYVLESLSDSEHSRELFGIEAPFLSKDYHQEKYWSEPFYINGEYYYVYSCWDETSCRLFDQWYRSLRPSAYQEEGEPELQQDYYPKPDLTENPFADTVDFRPFPFYESPEKQSTEIIVEHRGKPFGDKP